MGVAQGSLKARTGSDEVHTSVPRSESMVFQERPILSLGTLPHSVCPEEPTTHSCLLSRSKPLSSYEERTMILKDASKELNPYRRGWPKPSKRVAEAWWNRLEQVKVVLKNALQQTRAEECGWSQYDEYPIQRLSKILETHIHSRTLNCRQEISMPWILTLRWTLTHLLTHLTHTHTNTHTHEENLDGRTW